MTTIHIRSLAAVPDDGIACNENARAEDNGCTGPDRAFNRAVDDVHRHARLLVDAVNALDCGVAWLEETKVLRALSLAAFVVEGMPDGNRGGAVQRLNALNDAVSGVLEAAPKLSLRAVTQLRAAGSTLDSLSPDERRALYGDWCAEQALWITERRLAGALAMRDLP